MAKSIISKIIKNKEVIKKADVAKILVSKDHQYSRKWESCCWFT